MSRILDWRRLPALIDVGVLEPSRVTGLRCLARLLEVALANLGVSGDVSLLMAAKVLLRGRGGPIGFISPRRVILVADPPSLLPED